MTNVTTAMVSELRQKTGVGILDCRKALVECEGNVDAAVELLRKKGLAAAGKKAGRSAADGLVAAKITNDAKKGVVVEVNAETDFVARSEQFQQLLTNITADALNFSGNLEEFKNSKYNGSNETIEQAVNNAIAVIGENIVLRRFVSLNAPSNGIVASYVHNSISPNLGKISVLVSLESTAAKEKLAEIGKYIAMHIAAFAPESLTVGELPVEKIEVEKRVFKEQALAAGKPEAVVDKMVEGRIRKYYEEVVLSEQPFLTDNKKSVAQWLEESSKDCGAEIKIVGYVRYALGEGIEKQSSDFAAEVAAMVS